MEWLLADAKNKLSEVVTRAVTEGPQKIRRRNDRVILLSQEDYDQLRGAKTNFKEFLLTKTANLSDLNLSRDRSPIREVEL